MTIPPAAVPYTLGSRPELFRRDAIFLSASIPYDRGRDPHLDPAGYQENQHYLASARPWEVRDAVSYLCRRVLRAGLNLIFGAHPAISPMALDIARRFTAGAEDEKRIIIFQSAFFKLDMIPDATLELAAWGAGALLWTEAQSGPSGLDREASLTHMRELMVRSPRLLGGVFIGGMEGVKEESDLFAQRKRGTPRYALGSTGSAAKDLLDADPQGHCGRHAGPAMLQLLDECPSYPLVMDGIFEDLTVARNPP